MMKLFVIATIFAIPIMAQEYTLTYDKFGLPETIEKFVCKNVTAAVLEKQEAFYQEYVKCIKNTVDLKQMNQDMRFLLRTLFTSLKFYPTMTELQTSPVRLYSLSYCPKLKTLMDCEDTYSSIYMDCLPAGEVQFGKIKRDTAHRLVDYFCDNDGEAIVSFMKGNFFECGMQKQFELKACLKTFFATMKIVPDSETMITNTYCKSMNDFLDCTTTVLQQCELSLSPGKLMESLRSYIQKNGICATTGVMNLKMSLL